jgi:hypothetical protein
MTNITNIDKEQALALLRQQRDTHVEQMEQCGDNIKTLRSSNAIAVEKMITLDTIISFLEGADVHSAQVISLRENNNATM